MGFGPNIRKWFQTIYNSEAPPVRTVRVNGINSSPFHLFSGVPQGCPVSPLVFLLVAEALTRAINAEPKSKLRGYTLPSGEEIRLTQFADDTQFILKGYKYMRRMWEVLSEYEDATGMRANVKKFEGIRCGALKRKPIPTTPQLRASQMSDAMERTPKSTSITLDASVYRRDPRGLETNVRQMVRERDRRPRSDLS